jgi:hypothetical protein
VLTVQIGGICKVDFSGGGTLEYRPKKSDGCISITDQFEYESIYSCNTQPCSVFMAYCTEPNREVL